MKSRELIERVSREGEDNSAQPRLTRADWLSAALELLVESGIDAVRITRLAERVGVTRGSFYWHFADRGELLAAMIEVWAQSNTASIIQAAATVGTIEDRVLALFMCWLDPELFDPKLDFAVRDWARGDAELQVVIADADQQRMEAMIAMFSEHGFSEREAIIRARNFYYTQMGYYALNVQELFSERISYVPVYFESYTDTQLSKTAEEKFMRWIAAKSHLHTL
ncbi:TetR/AcrR family transcriptional regulator (plasmid) [Brucella sp. 6810]|uniref:TetR/AcrR family transcriptional regulator n=1 Tax=Brucella sp. 6810 TaxID=2769351 RepID=UPI00165C5D25|nr:TetR/AcrR family transcriptional regulator [Brucella sp. 6810]QNQ64411.1 TetR/AcrR family transcriptional regulator [Brucella sp. 6810]